MKLVSMSIAAMITLSLPCFAGQPQKFVFKAAIENPIPSERPFPEWIVITDANIQFKLPAQASPKSYNVKAGDCLTSRSMQTYSENGKQYDLSEESTLCEKNQTIDVSLSWYSNQNPSGNWTLVSRGSYTFLVNSNSGSLTFTRTEANSSNTMKAQAEYSLAR